MPLLVLSRASRESGVTLIPRPVEGEAEGKGRPAYNLLRLRDSAVGSAATTTMRFLAFVVSPALAVALRRRQVLGLLWRRRSPRRSRRRRWRLRRRIRRIELEDFSEKLHAHHMTNAFSVSKLPLVIACSAPINLECLLKMRFLAFLDLLLAVVCFGHVTLSAKAAGLGVEGV
ncbi:hypothetical protein C7M84_007746 [Penaeus vannamei]|uniref:Uncharacterized protein n=1 Tax=Penaeus vannamei TaxID=6689 RepID=A0A423UAK4_PENVA|nr:hypothetical protein C7M84_007746 [Penaeus vannamei]